MVKPITTIALLYSFVNFITTKMNGKPVYDFLHWENFETPLLIFGVILGTNAFYLGLCVIDEKIKAKLVAKRD